MYNNYDYPCGADTPDSPWNQSDPEEVEVDICVSQSLSKEVTVTTTDYAATEWLDQEVDEDGHIYTTGGIEYDFNDTDLLKEYHESCYNIIELLAEFKVLLEKKIEDIKANAPEVTAGDKRAKRGLLNKYKHLLEDCQGWTLDEEEAVEA